VPARASYRVNFVNPLHSAFYHDAETLSTLSTSSSRRAPHQRQHCQLRPGHALHRSVSGGEI